METVLNIEVLSCTTKVFLCKYSNNLSSFVTVIICKFSAFFKSIIVLVFHGGKATLWNQIIKPLLLLL